MAALGPRLRPGQAFGLSLTVGLLSIVVLGWVFGVLVVDILGDQDVLRVDEPVNSYLATHREAWLTSALRVLAGLASSVVLVPMVLGVGLWCSWRERKSSPVLLAAAAWAGAGVLAAAVQALIARPRPPAALAVGMVETFAFPSGRTTEMTAVVGILAYLLTRECSWPVAVTRWSIALVTALVVGFAHAYLGAQWLTDVVAGWVLGALWLSVLLATGPIVAGAGSGSTGDAAERAGFSST